MNQTASLLSKNPQFLPPFLFDLVPLADLAPLAADLAVALLAFSGGPLDFDFGAVLPAESLVFAFASFLEVVVVLGVVSAGSLAFDLVAVLELLGVSLISLTELVFAFLFFDLLY